MWLISPFVILDSLVCYHFLSVFIFHMLATCLSTYITPLLSVVRCFCRLAQDASGTRQDVSGDLGGSEGAHHA